MVDRLGSFRAGKIGSQLHVKSSIVLGALALVLLGACTTTTVAGSPRDTAAANTTVAPTVHATTTTEAPTTTRATTTTDKPKPTTTERPTTTQAPTTTEPPPPPPPANIVEIDPVATPLAAVGSNSGDETARIQQRLTDLGFWLAGVDGVYGLTTSQAVMAFQKYLGLPASGSVDEATAAYLTGMTQRARGRADAGTLIEIDKARQLIFFVIDGRTHLVFNTSTGNGEEYIEVDQNTPGEEITGVSLTPDGLHQVNREREQGWWKGDLGEIYRPKYFVGGVAIHGSNSVPNYPASHGCVRVTVEAMDFIWATGLMPMGTPVWVHERGPVV